MEKINIIESPKGTFSCELNVSVDEWKQILSDSTITTQSYKDVLMRFYRETGHKSTCKALSMRLDGNAKKAQSYNSLVTQFGLAVAKRLNRFNIIGTEGKECFWPIVMNPGIAQSDGLFEWTLRKEVVKAIEALGWNKQLQWIPFYVELADKLLAYKDNRKELAAIAYESGFAEYIKTADGGQVDETIETYKAAYFGQD